MTITSLDQKWLHVNDHLCEMLGFAKEELVKMTWVDLTHPDDLAMDLVQFKRLVSNEIERYSLDKRFIHKSGKVVYTHLTVSCKRKHDHTIDYVIASLEDITERKHLQEALTIREKELTEAQTIAKLGSWHVIFGADASRDVWTISKELRKLYGYTDEKEIDFSTGIVAMPPKDQELSQRYWAEAKRGVGCMEWDHRIIVNGEIRWLHVSARFTFDANGNALEARGTNQDITARKKIEEIVARNEVNLRAILDNIPYMVWLKDKDSHFVAVNQAFLRITGKSGMDEVVGKTDFDLWPHDLAQKYRDDDLDVMNKRIQKLTEEQSLDKGVTSWLETFKAPILDHDGNVLGTTGFARDITERKRTQDLVQHMAHYDALTDLPNRALFSDRLQQALVAAKRDKSHMALMFIDLDKFKPINDEFGHHVGDMLLKEAARRMQDCVRESDTVARIGGDEFVVLLPVIEEEKDALLVAEKIRTALNSLFILAGHSLGISSSSGIAVYPEHGKDESQLMKNADAAMYHAKKNGRNNVMLYQTDMQNDR
jgi:diguanylate cyclase (GGDEF)-like protein/PAS domain S-box-containing protein